MTREGYNKHKELIEAFVNGAEVQFYSKMHKGWIDTENPTWDLNIEYRIKPTKIVVENCRIEFKDCSFNDKEYKVDKIGKVVEVRVDRLKININRTKSTLFKGKEIAEAYAVLPQLIRLRDEYNEGWKPDWEIEYVKYYIRVYKNKWHLDYHSSAHCLLAFKTEETRDRFFEDHRDLIEIAKPFL